MIKRPQPNRLFTTKQKGKSHLESESVSEPAKRGMINTSQAGGSEIKNTLSGLRREENKWLSPNRYIISIELEVASGTYIRSIAEEIGRRLDVPAIIKNLRRTKIGPFSIDQAEQL